MKKIFHLAAANFLAFSVSSAFAGNTFNIENSFTIDTLPQCVPQSVVSFKFGTVAIGDLLGVMHDATAVTLTNCPAGRKINIKHAGVVNTAQSLEEYSPFPMTLATATAGPEAGRDLVGVAYFFDDEYNNPIAAAGGVEVELTKDDTLSLTALLVATEHYIVNQDDPTPLPAGDHRIETPLVI